MSDGLRGWLGRHRIRLRLTVLYTAVCLVAGLVVLGALLLMSGTTLAARAEIVVETTVHGQPVRSTKSTNVVTVPKGGPLGGGALTVPQSKDLANNLRNDVLRQLITGSALALVLMLVVATAVGWWVAAWVLRPVRTMTETARRLSSGNIHERIALGGPRDELRDLADTFDAMLERLDRGFASQRRFVANASHELRTPLAIERATIQVGLSTATPADLPAIRDELLRVNRRSERMLDGLLLLARSDHGIAERTRLDLADLARRGIDEARAVAGPGWPPDVRVEADLGPCPVDGDEVLLGQLVANLVRNALRHNVPHGWVRVRTSARAGLVVENSGPVVPPGEVESLFAPFRRFGGRRTTSADEGAGLGLAIVRSIVTAHGGEIHTTAPQEGGLRITVTL